MKVLILGASGYLGPHVAKALAPFHQLRMSDVKPLPATDGYQFMREFEFMRVDASSLEQVMKAAKGMDAIINLSVVREFNALAFGVNTIGCWNMMRAAVEYKIRRVINTGPHFTVAGPGYETLDYGISPDVPSQSGTHLYALTKSLGQEICRVFAEKNDIYVQDYLFYNFRDLTGVGPSYFPVRPGSNPVPFVVSGADAGEAFRLGLGIELAKLPSRCEVFFIFTDMPHGKFRNDKARRVLGFTPKDDISMLWRKVNPER